MLAHLVGRPLHHPVDARDEQQQERRGRHRDEGEVPVEPEHDAQHADDGEQVHQDAQRSRRCERLDRLDVVDDGGQDRAELVAVVVGERQALEVVVQAVAQVVRHPLRHALGVVVLDVACHRAHRGDEHHPDGSNSRQLHLVASEHGDVQGRQPFGHLVAADDIVDDDLQGPRRRQAHHRLQQHGREDDQQPAPVGTQQLAHQAHLAPAASDRRAEAKERPEPRSRRAAKHSGRRGAVGHVDLPCRTRGYPLAADAV